MKRFISVLPALALICSLFAPVYAQEGITGGEIREMLYKSSIANSDNKDEILSYSYSSLEDDSIDSTKTLPELGDITKSFEVFCIPSPSVRYNAYHYYAYYDYEEGDIFDYFNLGSEIRHDDYYMEISGTENKYFSIMIYGGRRNYSMHEYNTIPNENLSLDLDKLAGVINNTGLTGISDIRLCHMNQYFYYIKADSGEFEVSEKELTNCFRDNETLDAWTVYPLGCYFEFETNNTVDSYRAYENMEQRLDEVEIPEEFDIRGDEIRHTHYFEEYPPQSIPFDDIEGITAKAVSLLYEMGVVNGCGDGKFNPEQNITFEQINTMFNRLMNNDADYTVGFDGDVMYQNVANTQLRLLGDWSDGNPSMQALALMYSWMIRGIDTFDMLKPISRGDFAVILCNTLDQQMHTYGINYRSMSSYGHGGFHNDITLIDYLSGKRLNGMYAASKQAGKDWEERYKSWYFPACGDIIYKYYGENDPQFLEEMQKYGWEKKNQ